MSDDFTAATVRLKSDALWGEVAASGWPKIYGTVVDETETKARVKWDDSRGISWEHKRDLDVMS